MIYDYEQILHILCLTINFCSNKTISDLNKNYKKRNSWNKFVYSVQGKHYSKFKKTWEKLDAETVRLKNILDKNGTPTPKSNYQFVILQDV